MQVLLGGVRQVSGTYRTYLHSSIIHYVHVRENENAVTTNTDLASCSSPEQLGSSNRCALLMMVEVFVGCHVWVVRYKVYILTSEETTTDTKTTRNPNPKAPQQC